MFRYIYAHSFFIFKNRPEIAGQSNMDAGSGVSIWNQFIRPMKAKGATLISPATTSDPAGKQWMLDFFKDCGGDCDVSIIVEPA